MDGVRSVFASVSASPHEAQWVSGLSADVSSRASRKGTGPPSATWARIARTRQASAVSGHRELPGGRDCGSAEDSAGAESAVLASTGRGYKNLTALTTLANIEGYYYKPRMNFEAGW
jgi:DNA polymerase III alpha subunit